MREKKWTDKINPIINQLRVKILCRFLERGGGTKEEMLEYLNQRLVEMGQKPVKERLMLNALQSLREGSFDHAGYDELNPTSFDVLYSSGKYQFAPGTKRPYFKEHDDLELATMPFLAGILEHYKSLPAVAKLISDLRHQYNSDLFPEAGSEFFCQPGPKWYKDQDYELARLLADLMTYIRNRQMIQFHYLPVGTLNNNLEVFSMQQVAPMKIVLYEHFYYLIAVINTTQRIKYYRVDQIARYKVEQATDQEENPLNFNYEELAEKVHLKNHMDHVIGIWNPHPNDRPYWVTIEFSQWAASYIKKLIVHPSQEFVTENAAEQTYTIRLLLSLTPEKSPDQPFFERAPNVAFFLGRFREYAKVVSVASA